MASGIHSDLIRGNVNTIILRALFENDKYGYEICKEIEFRSSGQYVLKQPTLYSCLNRLEEQGFISSYWGEKTLGGRRKYYSLTQKGRDYFVKSQTEWEYSRTVIDRLISEREFDLRSLPPMDTENRTRKAARVTDATAETGIVENEIIEEATYGDEVVDEENLSHSPPFGHPSILEGNLLTDEIASSPAAPRNDREEDKPASVNELSADALDSFRPADNAASLNEGTTPPFGHPSTEGNSVAEGAYFSEFSKNFDYGGTGSYAHQILTQTAPDFPPTPKIAAEEVLGDEQDIYEEEDYGAEDFGAAAKDDEVLRSPVNTPVKKSENLVNYASYNATQKIAPIEEYDEGSIRYREEALKKLYSSDTPQMPKTPIMPDDKSLNLRRGTSIYDAPAPQTQQIIPIFQNNYAQHQQTGAVATFDEETPRLYKSKAEDDYVDTEYRNILTKMLRNNPPIGNKKTAAPPPPATEDYTVKRYDKQAQTDYNSKYYIFSNRLRFLQYTIVSIIMLAEVLAAYLIVGVYMKNEENKLIYILGLSVSVAIFLLAGAVFLASPSAKKRADFSLGTSLAYKFFATLLCAILIIAINMYIDQNIFVTAENYIRLILPLVLTTNIMLSSVVYGLLYKSGKFGA